MNKKRISAIGPLSKQEKREKVMRQTIINNYVNSIVE